MGVAAAPYLAHNTMIYRTDWAICDFKMTEIFPRHSTASYYLVVFLVALPLICSW